MTLAFCGSGRGTHDFHNQVPHRLVEIADGMFRNHNKTQIYVAHDALPRYRRLKDESKFGDLLANPGVQVASHGIYLHPCAKEASIHLIWQEGIPKVVWQEGIPNGHWAFYPFPQQEWGASNLNNEKPLLSLKFNAQGIEEEHP